MKWYDYIMFDLSFLGQGNPFESFPMIPKLFLAIQSRWQVFLDVPLHVVHRVSKYGMSWLLW